MTIDIDPLTGAPIVISSSIVPSAISPTTNSPSGIPTLTEEQKAKFIESPSSDLSNLSVEQIEELNESSTHEPVIHVMPSKSAVIDSVIGKPPVIEATFVPNLVAKIELESKAAILLEMGIIEEEFNGISNIPVNHEYYDLVKRYRSLDSLSKEK